MSARPLSRANGGAQPGERCPCRRLKSADQASSSIAPNKLINVSKRAPFGLSQTIEFRRRAGGRIVELHAVPHQRNRVQKRVHMHLHSQPAYWHMQAGPQTGLSPFRSPHASAKNSNSFNAYNPMPWSPCAHLGMHLRAHTIDSLQHDSPISPARRRSFTHSTARRGLVHFSRRTSTLDILTNKLQQVVRIAAHQACFSFLPANATQCESQVALEEGSGPERTR
jgi:hypothetical protein